MRRPPRRRSRRWLTLLVAATCLATVPGQAAVADPRLRFGDGDWMGGLTGGGTVVFNKDGLETKFISSWHGRFTLTALAGAVTGGEWQMEGDGTSRVTVGGTTTNGQATFDWGGHPTGDAAAPLLVGTASMHMRVGGQTFNVALTAAQTADPKLVIYTSDCTLVTGDWTAGISSGIEDNGGEPNIGGSFAAYNTTGTVLTPDLFTSFINDFAAFQGRFLDGTFDRAQLTELLSRAEALEALFRSIPTCESPEPGTFAIMAFAFVRDMIDYALKHPDRYTTEDLIALTRAGVRTGVLGAGSPDQEFAESAEDQLYDAVDGRLTRAIAAGDREQAETILELAIQMSWPDIATKAILWLNGA